MYDRLFLCAVPVSTRVGMAHVVESGSGWYLVHTHLVSRRARDWVVCLLCVRFLRAYWRADSSIAPSVQVDCGRYIYILLLKTFNIPACQVPVIRNYILLYLVYDTRTSQLVPSVRMADDACLSSIIRRQATIALSSSPAALLNFGCGHV